MTEAPTSSSPRSAEGEMPHSQTPTEESQLLEQERDQAVRLAKDNDVPATASSSRPSSQPSIVPIVPPIQEPQLPPLDSGDEEPAVATCFERSTSPGSVLHRNKCAAYEKVGEEGVYRMHRFSLYETASRFYFVGGDVLDQKFRVLKLDRTMESEELVAAEDDIVYTRKEMNQLLNAIDDGNKGSGGLKLRCSTWGLLGFIRFTSAYYMLVVTKRSQVAMIGGHYVYQIDGTELVPLLPASSSRLKAERLSEEARFVSTLSSLDLSRSFYFSYTYDVTRSLQKNMIGERKALARGILRQDNDYHSGMFVWNHHLLGPAARALEDPYAWCIQIIHGFVDQTYVSLHARTVSIAVIARRSRQFAGARFLKRGANDLGYVANDVETEQIVSAALTTSFHAPGPQLYANPSLTSYVQHRGSIPLHWTQDSTGVSPKPAIELNLVDPFFVAAAKHFDNLFDRYGAPIYVLNLVKARERTPRESILLKEYTNAITYLNQSLPEGKKIMYKAWDMSRASKSRDQDVIGTLESIAKDIVSKTGYFRNGDEINWESRTQNGVARTNCIDCLDRTNAAQFLIGKCALAHQLQALGVIADDTVDFGTDVVSVLSNMYHAHGDMIAIQYGGSHLVNTMSTYRKINQWSSHSRDMVESFRRYYHNSFLDRQRQEAYNLFLGNYIYVQGQPMLWDLSTDYYLHHANPRAWRQNQKREYLKWFDPHHLEERRMPPLVAPSGALAGRSLEFFDDYWLEYYRPLAISSLTRLFPYKANSVRKYPPPKENQNGGSETVGMQSTLAVDREIASTGTGTKSVSIADHPEFINPDRTPKDVHKGDGISEGALSDWLQLHSAQKQRPDTTKVVANNVEDATTSQKTDKVSKDKSAAMQWTLNQFVTNSLNPTVIESEADEYLRYINHPLNIPSALSADHPPRPKAEFSTYIQSNSPEHVAHMQATEDDIADFREFLDVGDDPLTVTEADTPKKRYKAYRQWLKGRSLFKQQRADV